jgi:hypothetical protein
MAKLFWAYKEWGARFPSFGGDEYCRHTLVLPHPFKVTSFDEEDGTKYRPALVLVIAPWWACRHIFDSEYRREAREIREDSRRFAAEYKEEDGDGYYKDAFYF